MLLNRLLIPTIDARLSQQMDGAWLNQFEARDASRMQVINDEAAQKALELCCQWQFILKFFNAVSEFKLCSFMCHLMTAYKDRSGG